MQSQSSVDPKVGYIVYLLGGAVGDALTGSVVFMARTAILSRFGPEGITDYAEYYDGLGKITDEGLLRGQIREFTKGISSLGRLKVLKETVRLSYREGGH